jgi:hypothetical protein
LDLNASMRLLEFLGGLGCLARGQIQLGMHHRLWEFSRGEGDSNHNLRCFAIHLPQWIAGEGLGGGPPHSLSVNAPKCRYNYEFCQFASKKP